MSNHSLRVSSGTMSATNFAPATSQAGHPFVKSPDRHHSLNGSAVTAAGSSTPVSRSTAARSASVARGVIRSTMVVAKPTPASM